MNKKLQEGLKKGEDWAFSEIYRKFMTPVQNYVFQKIQNESIAQELTQEVFLKAHRFSSQYEERFAITTWLWTIAKNTIKDFKREAARLETFLNRTETQVDELPGTIPDPEISLELKLLEADISTRATRLPQRQQKILTLRYFAQMSYREIAETLGISLASVKTVLYRARGQLTSG